jgi:hypothetical protein
MFLFFAAMLGINTYKDNNMGRASNLRTKISPPGTDSATTPRLYAKELADRRSDFTATPQHKHNARKDMSDMSFGSPPTEMDMMCQKEGQLSGTDSRATRYKRRRPSDDSPFFILQPSPGLGTHGQCEAHAGTSAGLEQSDVAELEREVQESKPAFEFSYFSSSFESSSLTPQPQELPSELIPAATHHDEFANKQDQTDSTRTEYAAGGTVQSDPAQDAAIVVDNMHLNYSVLPIK